MLRVIPHRWARAAVFGGIFSCLFFAVVGGVTLFSSTVLMVTEFWFSLTLLMVGATIQVIIMVFWIFYGLIFAKYEAFTDSWRSLMVAVFLFAMATFALLVTADNVSRLQITTFIPPAQWTVSVGSILDIIAIMLFIKPLAIVQREYKKKP